MIRGIGTDLVEMKRIEKIGAERLSRRILTEREQMLHPCGKRRSLEFVAGRFAAKEAISKALGTGIGSQCSFRDVEIVHDENGKPCVVFSADLREKLFGQKIVTVHLSISHSEHYALAMAVIEEREE